MCFSANPTTNLVSHFGVWIIGYLIVRSRTKPFVKVCMRFVKVGSKLASTPGVVLFI